MEGQSMQSRGWSPSGPSMPLAGYSTAGPSERPTGYGTAGPVASAPYVAWLSPPVPWPDYLAQGYGTAGPVASAPYVAWVSPPVPWPVAGGAAGEHLAQGVTFTHPAAHWHYASAHKVGEYTAELPPYVVSHKKLESRPENWEELWETQQVRQQYHPEHQRSAVAPGALPDAHRLPQYGGREVWWGPRPLDHGVRINAEFSTPADQGREVLMHDDDAIRASSWRHIGAFMPNKSHSGGESLQAQLAGHADWYGAEDLLADRRGRAVASCAAQAPHFRALGPDYSALAKTRQQSVYSKLLDEKAARDMVLDADEVARFFADSGAVMYEKLE